MAQAEWILYCDESGNTGKNFGDPVQPVFIEAGWRVQRQDLSAITKSLQELERNYGYSNREVKGAKLVKTVKGRRFS
jgi:hypothetical protein